MWIWKLKENNYKSIQNVLITHVRRKVISVITLPTKDALFALEISYGAAVNDIKLIGISKLEWNVGNIAYGFTNKIPCQ